jgi:hypothetical protein
VSLLALSALGAAWLARRGALAAAPVMVVLIALLAVPEIARVTTPDMMAAPFVLGAVLAFAERRHVLAAFMLVLAVLTRPDQAALGGTLALGLILFERDWRNAAIIFLPVLLAYLFASRVDGYPGWWAHVHFAQIEFVPTLSGFDPPFRLADYAFAVLKAGTRSLTEFVWLAAALALAIAGAAGWAQKLLADERVALALALTLASTVGKLFVFPMDDGRIYFSTVLAAGLLLASVTPALAARLNGGKAPVTPA